MKNLKFVSENNNLVCRVHWSKYGRWWKGGYTDFIDVKYFEYKIGVPYHRIFPRKCLYIYSTHYKEPWILPLKEMASHEILIGVDKLEEPKK